jgi:protein O-mannosyl-transferase
MNRFWNDPRLAAAFIAFAALLVYANALWNGFAYDDVYIIQHNARVHDLADLRSIWLTPYWPTYGEEFGLYRPLAILAYALQWAVGGGEPWLFHVVSVLLHAFVSVLVLRLLLHFLPAFAAFAGALLFAVHPVHTEAVANVIGQAELIAAAATVGACLIHLSRPAGTDVGWWRRIAYALLFLIAVLAKESAILLPVLLVVMDIAQRRIVLTRASAVSYARSLGMLVFLLGATTVGYLALRVSVIGSITGVDAGPGLPYLREGYRMITAFRAWPEFARLLFLPLDLSAEYGPAVVLPTTGMTPMAALGLLLLMATTAAVALLFNSPVAGLAAAWFLVPVLTVSNLLFPIGVLLAERTLYTPSIALSFLAGAAAVTVRGLAPPRIRLATVVFAAVVVMFGARTWIRNPDWASTVAVWQSLARDRPESYRTHWALGTQHLAAGDRRAAEIAWLTAHRIWPRDAALLSEFALFYLQDHRFLEAIPLLEEAERLAPWAGRPSAFLAQAYLGAHRFEESLAALARAPRQGEITAATYYSVLARNYEGLGDDARAIGAWRVAVRQPVGQGWLLPAMLARATARYGLREDALVAARLARERVPASDDRAAEAAEALIAAIADGCYAPAEPARCTDPIARWSLIGEGALAQPAKELQSATRHAAPSAARTAGQSP